MQRHGGQRNIVLTSYQYQYLLDIKVGPNVIVGGPDLFLIPTFLLKKTLFCIPSDSAEVVIQPYGMVYALVV